MSLSAAQYKILNKVSKQTKYMVHGYIHEFERLYSSITNIPLSIIQICILFLFQTECFEKCGKDMIIAGNNNDTIEVTKDPSYLTATYGATWIHSNESKIIRWTFKFIENKQRGGAIIAIISKEPKTCDRGIHNNKDVAPSYMCLQVVPVIFIVMVNHKDHGISIIKQKDLC